MVSVAVLTAIWLVPAPTLTTPGGVPPPLVVWALQVPALIAATLFPVFPNAT
jgi:hypothetical protein